MFIECKEGEVRIGGINYWFPKDNPTLWRIILVIPLGKKYQFEAYFRMRNKLSKNREGKLMFFNDDGTKWQNLFIWHMGIVKNREYEYKMWRDGVLNG
jgi:hypothetical protein